MLCSDAYALAPEQVMPHKLCLLLHTYMHLLHTHTHACVRGGNAAQSAVIVANVSSGLSGISITAIITAPITALKTALKTALLTLSNCPHNCQNCHNCPHCHANRLSAIFYSLLTAACKAMIFVFEGGDRSCLRAVIGAVKLGKDIPSLALLEQVRELLEPVRKLVVEEATESTSHRRGTEATDSTSHRAASSAADELQPCLDHVELLLVLVESVGSDEMVTSTHNLLRTLYITIGNKNKAQEHCRAALTHARARHDKVQVAIQNEVKGLLEVVVGG